MAFVGDARALDSVPSAKPVVTIEAGPTPVTEGTAAEFVVSRSGSTKEALTVSLGVAETGSMISGTAPVSIVLMGGEERKRLRVNTEQDDRDEAASSVTATVTAGTDAAYEVGTESSATVIVQDDDRASVRLSVQPDSISEAGGVSTVTVGLGATFATDQEIALTFSGSAEMGADYRSPSGSRTGSSWTLRITTRQSRTSCCPSSTTRWMRRIARHLGC